MKAKFFKHFVRTAAVVTAFSLISATPCVMAAEVSSASAEVRDAKISSYLKSELEDLKPTDKVQITVWLKDIDHDSVDEKAMAKAGVSEEQFEQRSAQLMQQDKLVAKQSLLSNVVIDQRTKLNEDVDNYIKIKRELNSKEITKQSDATISELGLKDDDVIYYDEYAPMLILEVEAENVNKIAANSNIEKINHYENIEFDSTIADYAYNTSSSSDSSIMYIHKAAIGGNDYPNSGLDGNGVTIGQIEYGLPNVSYFNGNVKILNSGHNSEYTDQGIVGYKYWHERAHATVVANILAGPYSMTPKARVYSASTLDSAGFRTCIQDFMKIGQISGDSSLKVDIINLSAAYIDKNANKEATRDLDLWLDYMININNLIVVGSAGNAAPNYLVSSPNLAYNAITVGAINDKLSYNKTDDYMEEYSSYLNTGYCEKPDIVAPGNEYYPNLIKELNSQHNPQLGTSGTSFSTPMVTSAVALMLQRDSTLKLKPYLIKSILLASCDRKVLDTDGGTQTEANNGITEKQGAGVINVKRAINIVDNKSYKTGFAYNKSVTYDITRTSTESFMTAGLAWNKYTTLTGNASTPYGGYDITNLNMILYGLGSSNSNYGYIASSFATNSSTEHIFASNLSGYNNKYRFAILKPTENEYSPQYALAWD